MEKPLVGPHSNRKIGTAIGYSNPVKNHSKPMVEPDSNQNTETTNPVKNHSKPMVEPGLNQNIETTTRMRSRTILSQWSNRTRTETPKQQSVVRIRLRAIRTE